VRGANDQYAWFKVLKALCVVGGVVCGAWLAAWRVERGWRRGAWLDALGVRARGAVGDAVRG
jgi:hypothetical protein